MENLHPIPKNRHRRCQFIPGEIIEEILLRLPGKSVARFRCVCTSWLSIGTNCSFLRTHSRRAPKCLIRQPALEERDLHREDFNAHPTCKFDRLGSAVELFIPADVFSFGRVAAKGKELPLPKELHSTCVRPLASCDGLVLLNTCKRGFYVLNPLTSKCTGLPTPHFHLEPSHKKYGFYFHRWTGEYRILGLNVKSFVKCEVLSLGSKSWRIIDPIQTKEYMMVRDSPVYASDFLHWICYNPLQSTFDKILAFDTRTELFTWMALPQFSSEGQAMRLGNEKSKWSIKSGLIDIEEKLGFYTFSNSDDKLMKVDFWIMEDYEIKRWTKFHSVVYDLVFCYKSDVASFDLHVKDGELLLVFDLPGTRYFMRCRRKSDKYILDKISTDRHDVGYPTVIYKESLIFYDSFFNRSTKRKSSATRYRTSFRKSLKGYGKCVKNKTLSSVEVYDGCLRFEASYDHQGVKHPYCSACGCHVSFHVDERIKE